MREPKCSFCDEGNKRLLTGKKGGHFICEDCVRLVDKMMNPDTQQEERPDASQRID